MNPEPRYPTDFLWGVATSAYQIEGSPIADGKGESIWDRFTHTPGATHQGATGDVACDHYRRWPEDIAILRELGIDAYRFSIAWPRIIPTGRGTVNARGLDFYDRLVDTLLAAGIAPYVTLYHWDLPQALQDQGGWANRDTVQAFTDYTITVARRLGDRVKAWITINEPAMVALQGHWQGMHAPGRHDLRTALQVAHHTLLAHGTSMAAVRAEVPQAEVGIALSLSVNHPAEPTLADAAAAQRMEGLWERWYLDPLFRGAYPDDLLLLLERCAPNVQTGDMATIHAPLDFLGVNYYTRRVVRAAPEVQPLRAVEVVPVGGEQTTYGWEVYPDGLCELLTWLHREYPVSRYLITENGAAFTDERAADSRFYDMARQHYLERHLAALDQARQAGVPVAGYFAWSLLDNFEWNEGYRQRFGLVHVDFATQQRTLKESAHWYHHYITAHRPAYR